MLVVSGFSQKIPVLIYRPGKDRKLSESWQKRKSHNVQIPVIWDCKLHSIKKIAFENLPASNLVKDTFVFCFVNNGQLLTRPDHTATSDLC